MLVWKAVLFSFFMKRPLALLCSVVFAFSAHLAQAALPFHDTQGHFSAMYVQVLQETCGITGYKDAQGTPLGEFHPDVTITRAELIAMIFACSPDPYGSGAPKTFPDVRSADWFAPVIGMASAQGWVTGYPDGTFRPNTPVNRAEALKILFSASLVPLEKNPASMTFTDVHAKDWFYTYVASAASRGFIQGRSTATFAPSGSLTRGEAAKLVVYFFALHTTESSSVSERQDTPAIQSGEGTTFMGCQIFPPDNPWNQDIRSLSVHPNSDNFIASILAGKKYLHPDFGSNPDYGIPFVVVDNTTPMSDIQAEYADETDAGPYPIPANPPIEAGSDRHILMLQKDTCTLYELYAAEKIGNLWHVGSGAIFDLASNLLRPDYWTSADAAGLPIFPGLVRYDEVQSGKITHALRFTVSKTQKGFIHPATHFASSSVDANRPPMGLRLRLKADYDISHITGASRVILEALKTYGMIVADNGSDWFISGATDSRWNDEDLEQIKSIPGSAFEAVYTGEIQP
ncbi:hypothetical protein COW46_03370 [Candidatus Gracilibacteria bacterium CG17_big_fil_post_rev_8_21_14_2_50_48_13]|nr:MAG: hypothetical protein COW46_03370 [Candidatus Gracilibacteria bacterium CG17_big_fil_post_rev_8_21_14_2_50_48_13]